jgi:hypothetical protein
MTPKQAEQLGRILGMRKQAKFAESDIIRYLPHIFGGVGALGGGLYGGLRERESEEKKANKSRLRMILEMALIGGGAGALGGLYGRWRDRAAYAPSPSWPLG